jgi:hypothetical protein
VRNLSRPLSTPIDNHTIRTRRTPRVNPRSLQRELIVRSSHQEIKALIVIVLVRIRGASSRAALLHVVVRAVAGRGHLGAGVARAAAFDVAGLAGLEVCGEGEGQGGEGEEGEEGELHGCGGGGAKD